MRMQAVMGTAAAACWHGGNIITEVLTFSRVQPKLTSALRSSVARPREKRDLPRLQSPFGGLRRIQVQVIECSANWLLWESAPILHCLRHSSAKLPPTPSFSITLTHFTLHMQWEGGILQTQNQEVNLLPGPRETMIKT